MELGIGKIEQAQFYIDKAFRNGRSRLQVVKVKNKGWDAAGKYRYLETIRLSVINDTFFSDLNRIVKSMPDFYSLDKFYQGVMACLIDIDDYKKSLGSIKWALGRISGLCRSTQKRIEKSRDQRQIVAMRNAFLARASSFLKQIEPNLIMLDDARQKLREVPSVKTSAFTAAIVGFPNVGKSTLLGKITSSRPEINSYAFTTKGLMIGHFTDSGRKIQIIDTPGTLNRFEKMNNIEKIAHLCMRMVADVLVYVFDLTEPYPIDEQIRLYETVKEIGKPLIVYFSKSDIIPLAIIEGFKIKGLHEPEKLKEEIVRLGKTITHKTIIKDLPEDEGQTNGEAEFS